MRVPRIALTALPILAGATAARAQTIVDGSGAVLDATQTLLDLIKQRLRDPEARVAGLRIGRAGALCGTVDTRNRMGAYTGPRGFVADIPEEFFGRLPEGPELRSPASRADFRAVERARTLFESNCVTG